MFEKVNPSHPDKIADRIAGAIVDLAYREEDNPKIAVEVLIGHEFCHIIIETSVMIDEDDICDAIWRIAGDAIEIDVKQFEQDKRLAKNQSDEIRCGDNGIFCGMPVTKEQRDLSLFARLLYEEYPYDGKHILADRQLIVCQSNIKKHDLIDWVLDHETNEFSDNCILNPLGEWTGGTDVDTGATNRKLGSDMGDAVTGGGLHGKDLSKADVSLNIYAHIKAQETGKPVKLFCAIGDDIVDGKPYAEIVEIARKYINDVGGFEKFAEWGLI